MKHLLILIAIIFFTNSEAKQKIYKWTDEDGNVHYTEKKPENKQTAEMKVYKSKPSSVKKDNKTAENETPEEELTAEQKAAMEYNRKEQERVQKIQDRENCKIAKQNKATLEKSVSVKKKNPATGEYIRMDKSEVKQKLREVNKAIKILCK